jgi:hypothetical protein
MLVSVLTLTCLQSEVLMGAYSNILKGLTKCLFISFSKEFIEKKAKDSLLKFLHVVL